jgi:hypothetical protein
VFYLAALREADPSRPVWKPLLATWAIGLLAACASAVQSFAWSFVLTNGGPVRATTNLMLYAYRQGFQQMKLGMGATLISLQFVVLFLLGLLAGLILILSSLRFSLAGRDEKAAAEAGTKRKLGVPALILGLLGGLAALLLGLVPFVLAGTAAGDGGAAAAKAPSMAVVLLNTFLPPLLITLFVQLPLSYLGALGIGAFRPLGRFSEWLLLPFCPWLFVGLGGMSIYAYQLNHQFDRLNTFSGLLPPLALSVPMLVLLTLFFKGQQAGYLQAVEIGTGKARAFFGKFVLPSLPLAGLLVVAGLFAALQEPFWSVIFGYPAKLFTIDTFIISLRGAANPWSGLAGAALGFAVPLALFFFLAFGVFQIFYLDRLKLLAGKGE